MSTRNVHLLLFMALTALPLHGDRRAHLEGTPGASSKPANIVQTATNIWSSSGPADGINMLVIDPHDQNVIYAGGLDLHISEDRGQNWFAPDWVEEESISDFEDLRGTFWVGALAVTAGDPSVLYVSAGGTKMLVKSSNKGRHWETLISASFNDRERFPRRYVYSAIATDIRNPQIIYVAQGGGGLSRVSDGGRSWSDFGCEGTGAGTLDDPFYDCTYQALATALHGPETLFAGGYVEGNAGLFKRVQGESDWIHILDEWEPINALALDPHTPGTVYAGTANGRFYRSTDWGKSWNFNDSFSSITALIAGPQHPHVVYLGTADGVYGSTDSGATWRPIGEGLSGRKITALAATPGPPQTLFAGTSYGVYQLPLSPLATAAEEALGSTPTRLQLEQNHPNPFNGGTMLRFSVPHNAHVHLAVYSLRGQRVATLADAPRAAGTYALRWDGHDDQGRKLASGVYLYRLQAGAKRQTRKLVLVR